MSQAREQRREKAIVIGAALAEHLVTNSYINGETIRLDGALRMAPK